MTDEGFQSLSRESLGDGVFSQLRDRILHGELVPGEALPSERRLAELLDVNRGAVREGLKRLQQARLVSVRHGGATQVRDWRREAGLEMLPSLLVDTAGRLNVEAARGILQLRQALAPAAAAAAAQRADAGLAEALRATARDLSAAGSPAERQRVANDYWQRLVDGAGNVAYRLAFNSLQSTYARIWNLLTEVLDTEFRDADTLIELADAVGRGDSAAAESLARSYVALGTGAIERLLDSYDAPGGH